MAQMKSKSAYLRLILFMLGTLAAMTSIALAAMLVWRSPGVSAGTTAPPTTSQEVGALPRSTPAAFRRDTGSSSAAGSIVTASYAVVWPLIDGNLTDWQGFSAIPLNKDNASTIRGEIPSDADLSAALRIAWAPNALYFAGVITDDVLIGDDSINVWDDDSIELSMASGGRSHQFTLGVDGRKVDQGMTVVAVTVVTRTIAGGWLFEAAIPSALLGGDLQGDQELPFTWALWDDDVDHAGVAQTHMFWQSDNSYSYRPTWGILRLEPPPAPTSTPTPVHSPTPTPTATETVAPTREIHWAYLPLLVRSWPPLPEAPVLDPIAAPDSHPSYAIIWHVAQNAVTYVLEQTTSSTFDSATQIYSGPGLWTSVPSQGIATYYYRVKGRNAWGDSHWSNVQAVEVRWESEPNETYQQANGPLVSGRDYYGYPTDAKDYFAFVTSADGPITFDLKGHAGGGVQSLIYWGIPQPDPVPHTCLGSPNCRLSFIGKAGQYYIQIYAASPAGQSSPVYTLRVTFP